MMTSQQSKYVKVQYTSLLSIGVFYLLLYVQLKFCNIDKQPMYWIFVPYIQRKCTVFLKYVMFYRTLVPFLQGFPPILQDHTLDLFLMAYAITVDLYHRSTLWVHQYYEGSEPTYLTFKGSGSYYTLDPIFLVIRKKV